MRKNLKKHQIGAYLALTLALAQIVLILASWLLTAAMPDVFVRSLLSAEGIRWFFGRFEENLASPLLVWLVLGSISYGAVASSGILQFSKQEYRQRVAMRLVLAEFVLFVFVMLVLILLPHAILLNVMGSLFPSSFSNSVIPYVAFMVMAMSLSFGLMSNKIKGIVGVYEAVVSQFSSCAPLFLLYVLAMQLVCSIQYLFVGQFF